MAALRAQLSAVNPAEADLIRHGGGDRQGMLDRIRETGAFRVESIKAKSAVEQYTTALQKQDVTFRSWHKQAGIRNELLREQYRLQNMSVMGWKENGRGGMSADVFIPREVPERIGNLGKTIKAVQQQDITFRQGLSETRMRMGLWSQAVQSASTNVINWGKNTQWAGRQMMVALSLPMVALAAGTGMLAYTIDKEMTRILKVYDYATTNVEAEAARIEKASMQTARAMSSTFGQSAEDTLNIIGELAATGQTGRELQEAAAVVSRASFLGELDRQDAIKTTISLQTVFGQNTKQLGETFEYLNAVENATSLTMRDMTIAIPKLSGVVKSLGGDYKDMGTMMTAAKSAGIDAAEGANMLKTVMFRSVSPYGKGRETFLEKTGIDLTDLVKSTNGEAIPTFIKMGKAMENLSNIDRNSVLKDVFGIYQGSKGGQFIEEMLQMADATTQVGRAAEVATQSQRELADTAEQEVQRMQQSVSGQFKMAVEGIKTSLAEMGEPFLKAATTILGGVKVIVDAFNGLSDSNKQVLLLGLTFLGVIGPIVMVSGVMVTMLGTLAKMGVSLVGLASRYRAVNQDEWATKMLTQQSTLAFNDQASAAALLSNQLKKVNLELSNLGRNQTLASVDAIAASASTRASTIYQAASGKPMRVTDEGRKVGASKADVNAHRDMSHEQALLINRQRDMDGLDDVNKKNREAAASTDKVGRSYGMVAANIGAAAGMMGVLLGGTNAWVNYLSIAAIAMPVIVSGMKQLAGTSFAATAAGSFKSMGGYVAKMTPMLATMGRSLAGMAIVAAGPLAIALAAAGAAFGLLHYGAKKAREEAELLTQASQGVAEAMNVQLLGPGEYMGEDGGVVTGFSGQVEKFKKDNAEVVEELKKLDNEALKERAIKIGMDVYNATQDADKAKQAVQVALDAGGRAEIPIDIRFADENWRENIRRELLDGLASAAASARSSDGWLDWGMDEKVKVQLEELSDDLGVAFGEFQDGVLSAKDLKARFDEAGQAFIDQAEVMVKNVDGGLSQATKNRIKMVAPYVNPEDTQAVARAMLLNKDLYESMLAGDSSARGLAFAIGDLRESYQYLSKDLGENTSLGQRQGANLNNLMSYTNGLDDNLIATAESTNKFSDEIGGSVDDLRNASGATSGLSEELKELGESYVNAQQDMMSDVSNSIFDEADRQYGDANEAAIRAIEAASEKRLEALEEEKDRQDKVFEGRSKAQGKRHELEDKTFARNWENRSKAIEASYDDRVDKIESTIAAEEKAEALRQKNFEAEKARISRLADMYNQNVDFNVALNSGDMDEAAKISNNMRATQQQWGLDDAALLSGDASEQRREKQKAEIEAINAAKEARLEQLGEEEERAKEILADRQEREKEALQDEKERYNESVDAMRKAEEEKTKAVADATKKEQEARKRALDLELAALKEFVPKNQAELSMHIANVEAAYNRHGGHINTKSREWSNYLAAAMNSATDAAQARMGNTAKWREIGEDVGSEIAEGMLGMTFPEFMNWMNTGVLPKQTTPAATNTAIDDASARGRAVSAGSAFNTAQRNAVNTQAATAQRGRNFTARHSGGKANDSKGSRAGRPMSAGLYNDEVPTILQRGEYVVNKKSTSMAGPILDAINSGSFFHSGGLIGAIGGMAQSMMRNGIATAMAMGVKRKVSEGAALPAGGALKKLLGTPGTALRAQGAGPGFVIGEAGLGRTALAEANNAPGGGTNPGGAGTPRRTGLSGMLSASELSSIGGGHWLSHDAAAAWNRLVQETGRRVGITDSYRSYAAQVDVKRRKPRLAAKPGTSNHGWGTALDLNVGGFGSDTYRWLMENAPRYGWRNPGWAQRGGSKPEPWHWEYRHGGGAVGEALSRGLRGGGYTLNEGFAKLHPQEAVLTKPLTQQLTNGIQNIDRAGNVKYDVNVNFNGPVNSEIDVERVLRRVLNQQESKMGRKRTIKD